MNCLICKKPSRHVFSVIGYPIFECSKCGYRMTLSDHGDSHIDKTFSNQYFFGGEAGYPNYLDAEELLIQYGHQYAMLLSKYFERPSRVLDVGAAAGFILKGLTDFGWEGYGVEPNNTMAEYGRSKYKLNIHTGNLELFQTSEEFDLICLLQVIAHLIDPCKAIGVCRNLLSERGFILIETWNYKSITARVLGKHWHEYSPPTVLHWFAPKSLHKLMSMFNFELVAAGRPRKSITGKHAKSLISFNLNQVPALKFLRFLIRLVPDNSSLRYPGDDLFWAMFKKA
jgi:2-polyprenyl-3-methyl-5-hydroxy-6-metoxy-1,4-benzoquinol methylase